MQTPFTLSANQRLVCFGEVLARLSTQDFLPLSDSGALNLHFAGAEANVAVQFAELGGDAAMVTRLPDNRLADALLEKLAARRVDTRGVLRGGERMGLYFLEPGFGPRASVITYDRKHSAMATARLGAFDWNALFDGATWFHWSGITPGLGGDCAAICREALAAAVQLGLKVSCDVNYRSALWTMEEAAIEMAPLVKSMDLCVCGATEARRILGAEAAGDGDALYENLARALVQKHGIRQVAMLIRSGDSAHEGSLRGMLFDGSDAFFSRTHGLAVVDRIGSGDSFAGALLYAQASGRSARESIELATAAAVWKHTIPGDWSRGSLADIEALAGGAGGAFVKR